MRQMTTFYWVLWSWVAGRVEFSVQEWRDVVCKGMCIIRDNLVNELLQALGR